jgi:NAD+ synthase
MCRDWGFSLDTLPIGDITAAAERTVVLATTAALPEGLKKLTRENMQARARGFLLMTLSNDRGWLLLSTGNKSEIAVGYSTLYGDSAGAYNPLKDVFKTTVYAVADWRNSHRPAGLHGPEGEAIPQTIIDRPPSAELSPDQLDTDSLPPYPVLDALLHEFVEKETPLAEVIAQGTDPALAKRVCRLLRLAEYKRRQAAPGPKTTERALTLDRRMPMTNAFDPGIFSQEDLLK